MDNSMLAYLGNTEPPIYIVLEVSARYRKMPMGALERFCMTSERLSM